MKKIMVATDFSERSDRALRRASLLAKQTKAALLLVNVVDDDQPKRLVDAERDMARQLVDEQAAALRDVDGIDCEARVVLALPSAGIVQASVEAEPDLLVIGPHRRQALRDMFVGTTAERTIRGAACPVLMANAPPAGPYRRALLTTDLSEDSRLAVENFRRLGFVGQDHVSILHVFDAPALNLAMAYPMSAEDKARYLHDERKAAAEALTAFIASVKGGSLAPLLRHDRMTPPLEILEAVRSLPADLVMVGTGGKGGLSRLLLGSVAKTVLEGAACDVLAVPSGWGRDVADG